MLRADCLMRGEYYQRELVCDQGDHCDLAISVGRATFIS